MDGFSCVVLVEIQFEKWNRFFTEFDRDIQEAKFKQRSLQQKFI